MNNRGQMVVFVIIAILLVISIILIFLIYRPPELVQRQDFDDPEQFIDKCVRESMREKIDIMLPQGGFLNPRDYKIHDDAKVAYLCKNVNYYERCITQYPRYITRLQEELESNLKEDVEACFILLEEELDRKGFEHSGGDVEIGIVLKPGIVESVVYRDFTINKGETGEDFSKFSTSLRSPLYDIAFVANEIVSQEARYCYFEYVGFNLLYSRFDVKKDTASDSTKIYSIEDKQTGAEMNIAIRGCAIPAGF